MLPVLYLPKNAPARDIDDVLDAPDLTPKSATNITEAPPALEPLPPVSDRAPGIRTNLQPTPEIPVKRYVPMPENDFGSAVQTVVNDHLTEGYSTSQVEAGKGTKGTLGMRFAVDPVVVPNFGPTFFQAKKVVLPAEQKVAPVHFPTNADALLSAYAASNTVKATAPAAYAALGGFTRE